MSPAKRDTNLATAGLAAAAVLVFGATAAFAAVSGGSAAKHPAADRSGRTSAAYGAAPGAGGVTDNLPDGAPFGQGPHGDETMKDATGQWVEQIWQTGKVESVDGDQVKVTDVTGLAWSWTVSPTADVLIDGTDGKVDSIQVGDTVSLTGTESDAGSGSDSHSVHTATTVTDPGHAARE